MREEKKNKKWEMDCQETETKKETNKKRGSWSSLSGYLLFEGKGMKMDYRKEMTGKRGARGEKGVRVITGRLTKTFANDELPTRISHTLFVCLDE
jgi:hypothetical protein